MIQVANPLLLFGLFGLLIPVAIHLLSRQEGRVIRIGSLRHLEESATQQFKGIRLNEVLLLLVRCLLLITLILFLSGINYKRGEGATERWLVVEPGLESRPALASLFDSLKQQGYEVRFLTSGLPDFISGVPDAPDYFTVAEELAKVRLAHAVVLTTNQARGFIGSQVPLSPHIRWLTVEQPSATFTAYEQQMSKDTVMVREGTTAAEATVFSYRKTGGLSTATTDTIRFFFQSDPSYAQDREVLEATVRTIADAFGAVIDIRQFNINQPVSDDDWLAWLSSASAPNITCNTLEVGLEESSLVLKQVSPKHWQITRRLNVQSAVESHLSVHLSELLLQSEQRWQEIAHLDRRAIPDSVAWPASRQASTEGDQYASASTPLLISFFLLLFIERALSFFKRL